MRFLLAFFLLAWPAFAQESVVADLSKSDVEINVSFSGSEILIFGAVKREAADESDAPLDVIVAVKGPSLPTVVRRKDRRLGIWVNTESADVDEAPSFYAVASSAPLSDILSETEDARYKITLSKAIRAVDAVSPGEDVATFLDALIRIKSKDGSFQSGVTDVKLVDETLFSMTLEMPANLVEGDYELRIFLTRDGQVVADYEDTINVEKVGLEQFIYALAHEQPLIYGLLSLFIAIAAGWSASMAFRLVRT